MLENEILSTIGNVGFPIAIAIYLLVTRDKVISANTRALEQLSEVVKMSIKK